MIVRHEAQLVSDILDGSSEVVEKGGSVLFLYPVFVYDVTCLLKKGSRVGNECGTDGRTVEQVPGCTRSNF